MKHKNVKFHSRMIIVVMLFFSFSIISYSNLISSVIEYRDDTKKIYDDIKFETVYDILLSNIEVGKSSAQTVSDKIERDIKNEYDTDKKLNKLKKELDNDNYPGELLDIFTDNIKGKTFSNITGKGNNLFIANRNGIICDMNISKDKTSNESLIRTWERENNLHYNINLTTDAVNKLVNQSSKIIVWDSGKDNYFRNKEVSRDILKEIYDKEGLDGFKNYEFLCPAYINEYSDIFGQEDFEGTIYNKTHKFIVVQKFNLYELITQKYSDVLDKDLFTTIDNAYMVILSNMYILGIFLCIAVVGTFFIMSILFNKSLDSDTSSDS